jgi:hypothetical protein
VLQEFLTEAAFWQRLGLRKADLRQRPPEQVRQYTDIIRLIDAHEAAQLKRQQFGR